MRTFGFNPRVALRAAKGLRRFSKTKRELLKMGTPGFQWGRTLPILSEWDEDSGSVGAYFFQDCLVARWIHDAKPTKHYDVGSRLDGFIGNLSVFRKVDAVDLRPHPKPIPNVRFHQIDLMQELPTDWIGKAESLSCLHTIEHFGLGRYGDGIDPDGYLKGLTQLKKMVAPGGVLYLSTPIGSQRIEFNAHRVFSAETFRNWFTEGWSIEKFSIVDDSCRLLENLDPNDPQIAGHFGCNHGVGIIAARKTIEGHG